MKVIYITVWILLFAVSASKKQHSSTAPSVVQSSSGPIVVPNATLNMMFANSINFSREFLFQYQYRASEVKCTFCIPVPVQLLSTKQSQHSVQFLKITLIVSVANSDPVGSGPFWSDPDVWDQIPNPGLYK
jgi:hypothetical protein